MHHVHISTTALFVAGLFLSAIIAIIVAGVVSIKRDRRAAQARMRAYESAARELYPQHNAVTRDGHWPAHPDTFATINAQRNVYGTPAYGMDPSLALVEGMLIGEALSSHHGNTIVNETYVDSAPSYDSGVTYDSGSSFDTDTSSGFDASW